jgi:hypothetical protein
MRSVPSRQLDGDFHDFRIGGTVKYCHEFHRIRNQEGLYWRGPGAIYLPSSSVVESRQPAGSRSRRLVGSDELLAVVT